MRQERWIEGTVNVDAEHIVLNYADDPTPVAWLAHDGDGFVVQFNADGDGGDGREAVARDLDAVLDGASGDEAWREAIEHCGKDSNGDPPVHWSYFPLAPEYIDDKVPD